MKKRFTEEQILDVLKQAEADVPVKELCRRHGFSVDLGGWISEAPTMVP
ncbi:TPA: transposase [Pseudomonas aeruginosa]